MPWWLWPLVGVPATVAYGAIGRMVAGHVAYACCRPRSWDERRLQYMQSGPAWGVGFICGVCWPVWTVAEALGWLLPRINRRIPAVGAERRHVIEQGRKRALESVKRAERELGIGE